MIRFATDYSINKKDSEAVVYCDAFGIITRLTRADFSSEEEFLKWKAISDECYHEIEKEEHQYLDHVVSLDGLPECVGCVDSTEMILIRQIQDEELAAIRQQRKNALMLGLEQCLTQKQRIRVWLVCVEGLTTREAALQLGVAQSSIAESVAVAKKKLKKFAE